MAAIDLIPLQQALDAQRDPQDDAAWADIENTARELANHLRVRNGPGTCPISPPLLPANRSAVDNHTLLGVTALPRTLAAILAAGAPQSCTPKDDRTAPINEILRVGANLCMDHSACMSFVPRSPANCHQTTTALLSSKSASLKPSCPS